MSNLKDFVIENSVLKKYVGNSEDVVIPEGVTEIGDFAFWENKTSVIVTLPDSVETIGRNAFEKCKKLEKIVLPQSLKTIGEEAFRLCRKLKSVDIPGSCESIGPSAFFGCSDLEKVVLNEGVQKIGHASFVSCINLKQINLPQSLEIIPSDAFNTCQSLTELLLHEGIRTIDSSAFGDCVAINKVELSKAVMDTIDAKWFRSRFNNVDLNLLWLSGKTNFDKRVGELCAKSILRKKDEYAAKIIQRNIAPAMKNFLPLLRKISVEAVNRLIADSNASGATEVTAVLLDWKAKTFTSSKIERAAKDQIEKELGFKDYTVADWRNVFEFYTVDGKVNISAYRGNDTEITIPAKIGKNDVLGFRLCYHQGRKVINEDLCKKITRVNIEQGVMRIDENAFMNCRSLRFVDIPDSVMSIGDWAFFNCKNLTSITIPGSVIEIGSSAFDGCKKLSYVTIQDGVKKIECYAFYECKNLISITIPNSVTSIGDFVFDDCNNLIIHAPSGSYAEKYAAENNIPFVAE